jgi:hypothetical protein
VHATVTGGRRAPRRAAGGGRVDTPAGGGQAVIPAGAIVLMGTHAYAMGKGGYGGSPNAEARKVYQHGERLVCPLAFSGDN